MKKLSEPKTLTWDELDKLWQEAYDNKAIVTKLKIYQEVMMRKGIWSREPQEDVDEERKAELARQDEISRSYYEDGLTEETEEMKK